MDTILIIAGFICCFLGLLGSFLLVLPGPSISWVGLLLLYFTKSIPVNYWVLSITFIIMITISVLDYVIPSATAKKFGGTKFGVYGCNIGLILGLFFPPIGFIIGPFLGAFVGELAFNYRDGKRAFQSATGTFIGFLLSTFIKFLVCLSFLFVFLYEYFTH
ncbi:MAG: DUF456 domain-containing protein [Flavobacterium sp.]|nr:DUF456 domain-containing protein [Flavobacterium sp.]